MQYMQESQVQSVNL